MLDSGHGHQRQGAGSWGGAALGPHLHGHHGLLGTDGRQEVLLAEELQRELDQEAADLLELLLGTDWVLTLQTQLGQVAFQLHNVTHVAGWQTSEHLEREEPNTDQTPWLSSVRVPLASQPHLLVDGGVAGSSGKPHLLVEVVTNRVRHVDGWVCVGAQNGPGRK